MSVAAPIDRARTSRTLGIAMVTVAVYSIALLLFFTFADPIYGATDRVLAWVILLLGAQPTIKFLVRPMGVPLLQFVAAQYVLLFSFPVFFESKIHTLSGDRVPDPSAITMALFCAVLALVSVRIGYGLAARTIQVKTNLLSFRASEPRLVAYAVTSMIGSLMFIYGVISLPPSLTQPMLVILSQDLGLAILALLAHRGVVSRWQAWVTRLLFVAAVLVGLASGSTERFLQPMLIWWTCQWIATGRGPKKAVLFLVLGFFLLQPVKSSYRERMWVASTVSSPIEGLRLYATLLIDHYSTFSDDAKGFRQELRKSASDRLSLLLTTAHYIELTPSVVDFKHGATLMYMTYTWVPRFLWSDKPTAQMANKLLPVEYGLQSAQGAKRSMFGVGNVAEVYANFGLVGIVPMFLIMGALYWLPVMLLRTSNSIPATAIAVAVTMNLMWIGSTIPQAFGGVVQQFVVQAFLLRALTATKHGAAQPPAFRDAPNRPPGRSPVRLKG